MVNLSGDNMQVPKMDSADLYREEVFTDRKVGSIRRMTPVKPDGTVDPSRKVSYIGEAQLLTSAGSLPLSFEIPAANLEEAISKYGEGVREAFERTMDEIEALRRKAASQIVIPKAGASPLDPTGGLGGLPGGGKLKLR